MALLIDLRTRQIDAIKTLTKGLKVKNVEAAPGTMTLEAITQFATQLPSIHLAWIGFRRGEFVPVGETNYPSQWVAYLLTKKDAQSDLLMIRMVEALAAGLPDLTLHERTSRIPVETITAENLFSGKLNAKGVNLWAVSWQLPVRLGADKTESWNEL